MSSDLYADLGMESEDEEDGKPMTQWPEFFDVNEVANVRKSELKAKPKLNNFKSMESLLQEYNIRDQLDKKMIEYDNQSQGNPELVGDPNSTFKARSASMGPRDPNQNDSGSHGMLSCND